MKIISFFKYISFRKITALSGILGLLITLPVGVWMVQQETKLGSSAYFEKPQPISTITQEHGKLPQEQPEITLIWPFLGKPGDAVLVYGENFGDNPKNKTLVFGNEKIEENKILRWEDDLIEFQLPNIYTGTYFDPINLTVGEYSTSWSYPITIYDLNTKAQVANPDQELIIKNAPNNISVEIYFENGQKNVKQLSEDLTLANDSSILTIVLLDKNDQPIPFLVDPTEFGF
jgi:hypothetical protein